MYQIAPSWIGSSRGSCTGILSHICGWVQCSCAMSQDQLCMRDPNPRTSPMSLIWLAGTNRFSTIGLACSQFQGSWNNSTWLCQASRTGPWILVPKSWSLRLHIMSQACFPAQSQFSLVWISDLLFKHTQHELWTLETTLGPIEWFITSKYETTKKKEVYRTNTDQRASIMGGAYWKQDS